MRFIHRILQYLRLPQNAGPNDPQTIIGPLIDPQIAAYYLPDTVVSNMIFQLSPGVKQYIAQVTNDGVLFGPTYLAFGSAGYDLSDVPFVRESHRIGLGLSGDGTAPLVIGLELPGDRSPLFVYGDTLFESGGSVQMDGPVFTFGDVGVVGGFAIDAISAPRGYRTGNIYTGGGNVAASTGTTEVAVTSATWGTEPTFTFKNNRSYELTVMGMVRAATAVSSATTIRVRKGAQTTSGTVLASIAVHCTSAGSSALVGFCETRYIRNASGGDVSTKLSVTNQRVTGTASIELYGDANQPLGVFVKDLGITSQQSGFSVFPTV